jgi:hypothetical protein
MTCLAKEEGMPPDKRETMYGTAFWANVRAGFSGTD